MAEKTRFLILGGYLGAGKTTLAINLARILRNDRNMSVAVITNDQGDVLVDTEYVKDAGFDVKEISGGCFCNDLDAFVSSARTLVCSGRPNVIIAEPIGTSTNILNSVVSPLRTMYPDEFSVVPLTVVVDCIRALDLLSNKKTKDTVELIPSNQIKEAEIIILSKADLVSIDDVEKIKEHLKTMTNAEIIDTSSLDMRNLEKISDIILSDKISVKVPGNEDGRKFAFEKAKLGWYSGTFSVMSSEKIDMYSMMTDIMKMISEEFNVDAIVHVKVMISSEDAAAKMSLVGSSVNVDGVYGSRYISSPGKLILNARIVSPPKKLGKVMSNVMTVVPTRYGVDVKKMSGSCFSPTPESPSHFFFE